MNTTTTQSASPALPGWRGGCTLRLSPPGSEPSHDSLPGEAIKILAAAGIYSTLARVRRV